MTDYTELQTSTNFSFLRGASHADSLFERAQEIGLKTLGITDRNTVSGIVRAHVVAKENNMRLVVGCRLDLQDGPSLLAYPTGLNGYNNLSELLTLGNRRTEKGSCLLNKADLRDFSKGILFAAVPPIQPDKDFEKHFVEYKESFGRQLSLAATHYHIGIDAKRLAKLAELSNHYMVPLLATNDVHYHVREQRELQDTMASVREKCLVKSAGYKLFSNAERCLKPAAEMQRLFRHYPQAIRQTQVIAEACQFSLSELKYEYPAEVTSEGRTPQQELEHHTWRGVSNYYGGQVPVAIEGQIKKELSFIAQANFAEYFLTVYDIVRFARENGILCSGRGSAANSAVCYYLGITPVDPARFDLLFERFISNARKEPPDIDVDFEHERREEVIQYIFNKYGRERAAIVATNVMYRQKSAVKDIGKALGLTTDITDRMSDAISSRSNEWFNAQRLRDYGLDPADPHLQKVLELSGGLLMQNTTRHLSQHTGGFVIARGRLSALCPIMNASMENRTTIEWDKNDIDELGFMKIDVLALGMLTCMRKCFEELEHHYGIKHTMTSIPQDDPLTYNMICAGETMGVFQIESRAQMQMLPRLKPRTFYDLVIEVAIVRPGPIQGNMVHPYIRRRNGQEPVIYPSRELKEILGKTLGVPLFQEQAMKIAIVAAGFTADEADQLRRSMATFKFTGGVSKYEEKLVNGMVARGYDETFARNIFNQLKGFGSYGFPESHAASFAHLVYVSCWLKCHYPDVFVCGLLNSQPMGFYKPAQLVQDARKNKVVVRPPDINHSDWNNTLEQGDIWYRALRIGLRQIRGMKELDAIQISECRTKPYTSVSDLWRRTGLPLKALELLASANCFQSLGLDRREALWEVKGLGAKPMPLFAWQENEGIIEPDISLDQMSGGERVVQDYTILRLSLNGHPLEFIRSQLSARGIITVEQLQNSAPRSKVKIAGLVLVRQRPGTAGGITFVTLEDETGAGNGVVFKKVFDTHRPAMLQSRLMVIEGWVQRSKEGVVHLVANKVDDYSSLLGGITNTTLQCESILSKANEFKYVRNREIPSRLPAARNFH